MVATDAAASDANASLVKGHTIEQDPLHTLKSLL